MFYLLESPVGLALFNEHNEDVALVAKLHFTPDMDPLKAISGTILPETVGAFLKENCPPASTLNTLNPEIYKIDTVNVVCKPNDTFRKIRVNPFKYFGISKDVYNQAVLRAVHKSIKTNSNVDTILIDILNSIEELEVSINNRIMRVREWYSVHFPELNRVSDHMQYLKYVLAIGNRSTLKDTTDLELDQEIKDLIPNSMGCEFKDEDSDKIINNVEDILRDVEFKNTQLSHLRRRTMEAFPNLFNLIGDVLTVKLIRKAGSIIQLAQQPASTVQIYGAEKAFNEAVKEKSNTPKHGFIYASEFIQNAPDELKGKIARVLANKISLCARVDSNGENGSFGVKMKESILKLIEKGKEKAKKKEIVNKKKRVISVKEYDTSRDGAKRRQLK